MQEHAAECRQLVIRQSIHTGGEEVEFVHGRRVQSGVSQFRERVGAGDDNFADGEVSQPVRRVGDFAARSRKFQRSVKQISRRRLRGQFDGCLKIVCHSLLVPFFDNAVLGIDLFDICHDVGENRHDNAVSRQLVELCVAQMKLILELEELGVLKAHQTEAFLGSRLAFSAQGTCIFIITLI